MESKKKRTLELLVHVSEKNNEKKNQNLDCKNNEIERETLEQIADERESEREVYFLRSGGWPDLLMLKTLRE